MNQEFFVGQTTVCSGETSEREESTNENVKLGASFDRLFMSCPSGLYIVQDGKFKMVNPKFQKQIGYTEEELLGRESLSFVIPEHRDQVRADAIMMLKGQRNAPYEYLVMIGHNEPKWIMETVTSIDYHGKKATFGNFMDITARKLAEEGLREREELYRAVVEQATELICVIDVNSKAVIEANPAFRELLGYTDADLRSMTLYDFVAHDRANVDQHFALVVEHGEHFLGERTWRCKDGSLVEMEVSGNPLFYGGRQALCVVARDISDRKRAENERRFLTQRLMSIAEDERKKLSQDLHDELGQMLTALRFVLDALQASLPKELEIPQDKCADASLLVEQIGSSVRNLLFELRPSLLDDLGLVPTLQWYITRFMSRAPRITVKFEALGVKGRLVPDQETVLFRVLQECLNNVVKHARAENVMVSLTCSYPKIIFLVKDDGIGFDPRQARNNNRGIGLPGMRERVASLGGSFEVISGPGQGTIIRVELIDFGEGTHE
jgi:PAS domain S-box-containing protein